MNIGEAAERSGLTAKTIRYYEDIGFVVPRRQAGNQYRDYSAADIDHLRFLQQVRAGGFGLAECRLLLDIYRNPGAHGPQVKPLLMEKIAHLDHQLTALATLRETLVQMAVKGDADGSIPLAAIEGHQSAPMPFRLVEAGRE